jgi:hypothetical protein
VQFEIHRASVWNPTCGKLCGMTTSRKLVFQKSDKFTGWSCTACGWAKPLPRLVESEGNPPNVETDFANHDCGKHPWEREDFGQVAARIAREATENK